MKQILLPVFALSLLLLSGCSLSEPETATPNEMRFAVTHPSGAVRATGDAFESGDVMGVYVTQYAGETPAPLQVSGNYANYVRTAFDGTAWKSDPVIYWADGKFDVYAYYPYALPASVDEYRFSVALDQSVPETADALSGYEASDFLWAKAAGVTRTDAVPLTFTHRMSKLVVKLVKGPEYTGEIPADAVIRIHNTVPAALIDLATGNVMKNSREPSAGITARKVSLGVYDAVIVPQRLDNRRPLVEVLAGGVSYLIESSFVFKAGTQHTLNVTLNDSPDRVRIEIGGEIEGGWES